MVIVLVAGFGNILNPDEFPGCSLNPAPPPVNFIIVPFEPARYPVRSIGKDIEVNVLPVPVFNCT